MLETVREYGLELLGATPPEPSGLTRPTLQALAESAELVGPEQQRWLAKLDEEQDNLRVRSIERQPPEMPSWSFVSPGRSGASGGCEGRSPRAGPPGASDRARARRAATTRRAGVSGSRRPRVESRRARPGA